ncbi:MAG: apolipoprotein N-acyltransferase [SAR324 cluster bacterium]|nr:apolipoprotein N-acyltransferase [SAR324 cluster bacterium]
MKVLLQGICILFSALGTAWAVLGKVDPWLVPVFLMILGWILSACSSEKAGLGCGFFWGMTSWLLCSFWIIQALRNMQVPLVVGWFFWFLISCYSALPYALASWLIVRNRWLSTDYGVMCSSALLTLLICWQPHPFPGTPAHGMVKNPMFIQLLEIGGTPCLLFMLLWLSWQTAHTLELTWYTPKFPVRSAGIGLAILCMSGVFSFVRFQQFRNYESNHGIGQSIRVGAISPYMVGYTDLSLLLSLSETLLTQTPHMDLLIWPEESFYQEWLATTGTSELLQKFFQKFERPLIASGTSIAQMNQSSGNIPEYLHNTAWLLGSDANILQTYHKRTLLPFSEYLPLVSGTFMHSLFPQVFNYIPGQQFPLFNVKEGIYAIPLICYETLFSEDILHSVRQGGNLLVGLSNQELYHNLDGAWLHDTLSRFRAVEYRLPMVMVNRMGNSMFIQPSGWVSPSSINSPAIPHAQVEVLLIPSEPSWYVRGGHLFQYILILPVIWMLFAPRFSRSSGVDVVRHTKQHTSGHPL